MKRILLALCFIALSSMAFSVGGSIYVRYIDGNISGPGQNYPGPDFNSYWPNGFMDYEIAQSKPGTGFDLNFDDFGITYHTRAGSSDWLYGYHYSVNSGNYDLNAYGSGAGWVTNIDAGWKTNSNLGGTNNRFGITEATSPGYIRIRDLRLGSAMVSFSGCWWEAMGFLNVLATNTNGGAGSTNSLTNGSLIYNRFYVDCKWIIPLSDNITIKNYDWTYNWFVAELGDYSVSTGGPTNKQSVRSYTGQLSPVVVMDFNPAMIEIEPRFMFGFSNANLSFDSQPTNDFFDMGIKVGANFRLTYALNDMISPYGFAGFFWQHGAKFHKTTAGDVVVTNMNEETNVFTVPFYLGIKMNVAPGISMTLGYGLQWVVYSESDDYKTPGTTNKIINSFFLPRSGWGLANWGDTTFNNSIIGYQAYAKFANNWEMGISYALTLNDAWPEFWNTKDNAGGSDEYSIMNDSDGGQKLGLNGPIYKYDNHGDNVSVTSKWQLLHFVNQMNWDDQMYLKYEDSTVMVKGTIAGNNKYYTGHNPLLGLFSYVDFAYKF